MRKFLVLLLLLGSSLGVWADDRQDAFGVFQKYHQAEQHSASMADMVPYLSANSIEYCKSLSRTDLEAIINLCRQIENWAGSAQTLEVKDFKKVNAAANFTVVAHNKGGEFSRKVNMLKEADGWKMDIQENYRQMLAMIKQKKAK